MKKSQNRPRRLPRDEDIADRSGPVVKTREDTGARYVEIAICGAIFVLALPLFVHLIMEELEWRFSYTAESAAGLAGFLAVHATTRALAATTRRPFTSFAMATLAVTCTATTAIAFSTATIAAATAAAAISAAAAAAQITTSSTCDRPTQRAIPPWAQRRRFS